MTSAPHHPISGAQPRPPCVQGAPCRPSQSSQSEGGPLQTNRQRRLASRFKYDGYVLNYGAEKLPPKHSSLPELRAASPGAYLLHSSWAMGQLRQRGPEAFRQLGFEPAADETGATAAAAAAKAKAVAAAAGEAVNRSLATGEVVGAGPAVPPLLRLARKRAGPTGRLMLTFVTTTYDALCGNFVLHLRRLRLSNYLLVTFDASQQERLLRRGEESYLHELKQLKSGGSDDFASKDFFLINSARYSVLVSLLRGDDDGGLDVFALDLDAALLRGSNPEYLLRSSAIPNHTRLLSS